MAVTGVAETEVVTGGIAVAAPVDAHPGAVTVAEGRSGAVTEAREVAAPADVHPGVETAADRALTSIHRISASE